MSFRSVLLFGTLSLGAVSAAACSRPEIVPGEPAVTCVYDVLKADPEVQTIEVFRRDADRSAIEYSFRDKKGKRTEDIEFLTLGARTSYGGPDDLHQWLHLKLNTRCSLASNELDDMRPASPPRSAWRRVAWPPQ